MRNRFLFALLLSPAALFAQKGDFVLKGKVGSLNEPAKVYLMYYADEKMVTDSAVLKEGNFELKGNTDVPTQAMMILRRDAAPVNPRVRDGVVFYLDKGMITVNSADSMIHAKFSGSKINEENEQLTAELKPASDKEAALYGKYAAATPEMQQSEAFQNELNAEEAQIKKEENNVLVAFIKKHPKSVVSLDALQRYGGGVPENPGELDTLYQGLAKDVRDTKSGVKYGQMINNWKHTAVGAIAPDFTQNDTLGNPVKLSDFRGKYLLVDFWASWCGPCRAENPNVVAAFNKYKDRKFTILSVSLDQPNGHDAWIKAIHKDGLAWTHVSDLQFWNNAVAKMYGVQSVPQNFLLDPQGKIVAKNLRGEALDKKLDEILKN